MKVLRNNQLEDCPYQQLDEDQDGSAASHVLIPLERFTRERDLWAGFRGETGVIVSGDAEPDALLDHTDSLGLVCIHIPKFTDGRGYSLAVMLRRAGYRGTLRAVGDILFDQIDYLRRCGFDEFELKDPVRQHRYPAPEITRHYQDIETDCAASWRRFGDKA